MICVKLFCRQELNVQNVQSVIMRNDFGILCGKLYKVNFYTQMPILIDFINKYILSSEKIRNEDKRSIQYLLDEYKEIEPSDIEAWDIDDADYQKVHILYRELTEFIFKILISNRDMFSISYYYHTSDGVFKLFSTNMSDIVINKIIEQSKWFVDARTSHWQEDDPYVKQKNVFLSGLKALLEKNKYEYTTDDKINLIEHYQVIINRYYPKGAEMVYQIYDLIFTALKRKQQEEEHCREIKKKQKERIYQINQQYKAEEKQKHDEKQMLEKMIQILNKKSIASYFNALKQHKTEEKQRCIKINEKTKKRLLKALQKCNKEQILKETTVTEKQKTNNIFSCLFLLLCKLFTSRL